MGTLEIQIKNLNKKSLTLVRYRILYVIFKEKIEILETVK